MPLPTKNYFFLQEIADRWGATVIDIATYAHEGLIELSVMAIGIPVETGFYADVDDGEWVRCPTSFEIRNGVQPILKDDIWPIIQNRVGSIDHFRPRDPYHYARFHECAPLKVTLQQLLITREERDRFEDAHKIEVVEPDVRLRRECFTHDADYAHVDLLGRSFTLGATQARIVRALHEASLAGSPWVRQDELLERCGAKSSRLVDVFKAKQDWRQLITHDGRGRWRLNLPERGPSKARQQAFRRAVKSKVIVLQRDL